MREIMARDITEAVRRLCIQANTTLNPDVYDALKQARGEEPSPVGCSILDELLENAEIAKRDAVPICQDTGMAVVFLELGQEVHITGGLLEEAIHEGVRQGYGDGFLRKSVVADPFLRKNTGDNTPAVIHIRMVAGDGIRIDVAPKGFGSENMSRIFMLRPSDGMDGAKDAVIRAIAEAGPNPCPPMVVGVGCGGTFEQAALLAKRALLRPIGSHAEEPHLKEMEDTLLVRANSLGIGPQGLGGRTTVLAVHVLAQPTHIAGLPVAVNISCHVTRHAHCVL